MVINNKKDYLEYLFDFKGYNELSIKLKPDNIQKIMDVKTVLKDGVGKVITDFDLVIPLINSTEIRNSEDIAFDSQYAGIRQKTILTNDLIKFNNSHEILNLVKSEIELKLIKNRTNLEQYSSLNLANYSNKIKPEIEKVIAGYNVKRAKVGIHHEDGDNCSVIDVENYKNYTILNNCSLSGINKFSGENYISNSKLDNNLVHNAIIVDSYLQNHKAKNSIETGVVVFGGVANESILGDGNKVLLLQDEDIDKLNVKMRNITIQRTPSLNAKSKSIFQKLCGLKFKANIVKSFIIGAVVIGGTINVANAQDIEQNYEPHPTAASISSYASSQGYNLNKLSPEQKSFMNVDNIVQMDEKGNVISVENHGNKLIGGIGYLMPNGYPDLDYQKTSTTDGGKNWTIATNFGKTTVSSTQLAFNDAGIPMVPQSIIASINGSTMLASEPKPAPANAELANAPNNQKLSMKEKSKEPELTS